MLRFSIKGEKLITGRQVEGGRRIDFPRAEGPPTDCRRRRRREGRVAESGGSAPGSRPSQRVLTPSVSAAASASISMMMTFFAGFAVRIGANWN